MPNRDAGNTTEPVGPTSATAGLSTGGAAAADVIAVLVFALLARIAHNSEELPLTFFGWLDTTWPFLVGTALVWGLIVSDRLHRAPGSGWVICAVTWVTGMIFWGIRHSEIPHWSFMIVAAVMLVVLLIGWRAVASRVTARRR
ncbi:DUF3054 domain-containing protein [Corynebacterium terpenotabidum]|uniref:DUF3054 domain-containing protein n=1 Tax=Corynebacterium terpenotabidum Y-11 TaxID=1200352 RepID=S4XB93_9CORY|nr:DUF3054 domain-containing protein [Corynebacterium terpenotabidum]AGP29871.1 hypothetical protein A606_01080 [Corynebacterium terpenotabidum Y-11]